MGQYCNLSMLDAQKLITHFIYIFFELNNVIKQKYI